MAIRHDAIMAGVGGKGALTIAQVLAQAGMSEYKYVLWYPNYTTARRGAPCDATIILSEEEITSPLVFQVESLILVEPSRLKPFEPRVQSGGLLVVESFGLKDEVERKDVKVIKVPGVEIAAKLGDTQVGNFVLLGAYLKATRVVPPELIEGEIERRYKGNERMMLLNIKAFEEGLKLG